MWSSRDRRYGILRRDDLTIESQAPHIDRRPVQSSTCAWHDFVIIYSEHYAGRRRGRWAPQLSTRETRTPHHYDHTQRQQAKHRQQPTPEVSEEDGPGEAMVTVATRHTLIRSGVSTV